MSDHAHRIAYDRVGIDEVSTVELAARHVENGLRYETMVVSGIDGDIDIRRYATVTAALRGHRNAVRQLQDETRR